MRRNVLFLLSCTSGAVIQLMATATPAEAAYRYVAGVHCPIDKSSYEVTYLDDQGINSGFGVFTMCGLPTDDVLPPASISYLEVNGYEGSTTGGAKVSACVTFYTQNGWYCGTETATDNAYTGMYALTPDLDAFWDHPDDYPFVRVWLPSMTDGPYQYSSVAGIYYQ